MFTDNGKDYCADIVDARTQAGSKTLQQLGVVTQLQRATAAAYTAATGPGAKTRFTNVFGKSAGIGVMITIDNSATYYEGAKTPSKYAMTFHIDYLTNNPAELQQAITDAITVMNGMTAM
jgi:hypothetical protein